MVLVYKFMLRVMTRLGDCSMMRRREGINSVGRCNKTSTKQKKIEEERS